MTLVPGTFSVRFVTVSTRFVTLAPPMGNRQRGNGYVAEKAGDYAGALALEHRVWVLLFETFGGFSPDVVKRS